ncbi:hypothetical protein [Nocardia salmonicida]|uniref:hypothetical protein n=1 Tax=Nocardia salmonicida TaxID=53431 RepID=UPI003407B2D5
MLKLLGAAMIRGRGWTGFEAAALQEAMRKSNREFAALLGVETTTVNNWRAGLSAVRPRSKVQEILDTTLRLHASEEGRARFEEMVGAGQGAWEEFRRSPRSSSPATTATRPARGEVDATFERPSLIIERMRLLRAKGVDDGVVDVIEVAFSDILIRYEAEGPTLLAPEVLALRRQVDVLLEQCRQPLHLARLYRFACQMSGALAYMAVNLGRFQHARMYGEEALGLAEFTRDLELIAWVRGTQSFCSYYQGDYTRAVDAAQEGLRVAGSSEQAIRLYANGLARALGKLGDSVGVHTAIEAALNLSDRTGTSHGLTPALSFEPYSVPRLMANAATAHLSAGDHSKTLEYGQLVSELVDTSESVWSQALVRLDVATALVKQKSPDTEHAMSLARQALAASHGQPIRSVWQRAHELADVVDAIDRRVVGTYLSELEEWSSSACVVSEGARPIEGR